MSASTHFIFHHKLFNVEESYFTSQRGGRDPCFNLPMGEVVASVPIEDLRKEFDIPDDSDDGRLLGIVEAALKYVRVIRTGDEIPNELLDGSASWSVEDRHLEIARCRIALRLVTWVTGKKKPALDLHEFQQSMESPRIKEKIKKAIERISQQLEPSEQAVKTVERKMELLAHELSYIEGLRERFGAIRQIETMVDEAKSQPGQSVLIQDNITRVSILLSYAAKKILSEFDLVDQQNQDILAVLCDLESQVKLIRAVRDEIHYELKTWDEVVAEWQAYKSGKTDQPLGPVIEHTYRLLAQNYPIVQVW